MALVRRKLLPPTQNDRNQQFHLFMAHLAVARAHEVRRRANSQLLSPVSPGEFQRLVRGPTSPFDVDTIFGIEAGDRGIPPIPQVGTGVPPIFTVQLDEHRHRGLFGSLKRISQRTHQCLIVFGPKVGKDVADTDFNPALDGKSFFNLRKIESGLITDLSVQNYVLCGDSE